MGRQHSEFPGSSRRGSQSQQIPARHRAGGSRMKLMQLQRTMARAVMQPLTSSERMQRRAPDGGPMKRYASRFIKPNDRLTSFERLEIYNRQYWFRVLTAISEDFPGLHAVLGERLFDAMAKAYL